MLRGASHPHGEEESRTSADGLIGTPGRIVDHLERGNINLDSVRTLILDEFDKSLELGFLAEMKEILAHLPGVRRRVLTSATAAVDIPAFTGITAPVRLSFLKEVKESKGLALRVVKSPVKDKLETLYKLLGELKGGSAYLLQLSGDGRTGEQLSDRNGCR